MKIVINKQELEEHVINLLKSIPGNKLLLDHYLDGAIEAEADAICDADGNVYVGEWRDSKVHGQGTYIYASGGVYVGEYRDDKCHGQGTFTFASGDVYVGEVRDGKISGEGTH